MGQNENTVVETKSGKLQGVYEDGLYVFRGIPYAAPPVGKLRWQPPAPVESWSGVRKAEQFGPISPQLVQQMSFTRQQYEEEPQDEDCLFLNIWSPGLDGERRPVMVWIHGGAFSMGSGSSPMHPGGTLPKRGGVVLVTVNYRLGPLGFLNLKEATGGRIPATGNEGLLDQIAAVGWVRDNIAAFGGDPENITVFGESAGAMSIGCLLAMPEAQGLYRKAILESGANTVRPLDEAVQVTDLFLEALGVSGKDIDSLMSLPVERMLAGHQEFGMNLQRRGIKGAPFEPVVEGVTLPDFPLDAVKNGSAGDTTVLTGSNLEEAKIFLMMNPAMVDTDEAGIEQRLQRLLPSGYIPDLIKTYRAARSERGADASPGEILMAIQTDIQFRMPGVRVVEAQSARNLAAYHYLFTWESPVPGLGACHALDVGFVFGNLTDEFQGTGPEAQKLAGIMQDAWIAFARSGNPSCEAIGDWLPYGNERSTMILDKKCRVENAPYEEERRAWDNIPNRYLG